MFVYFHLIWQYTQVSQFTAVCSFILETSTMSSIQYSRHGKVYMLTTFSGKYFFEMLALKREVSIFKWFNEFLKRSAVKKLPNILYYFRNTAKSRIFPITLYSAHVRGDSIEISQIRLILEKRLVLGYLVVKNFDMLSRLGAMSVCDRNPNAEENRHRVTAYFALYAHVCIAR